MLNAHWACRNAILYFMPALAAKVGSLITDVRYTILTCFPIIAQRSKDAHYFRRVVSLVVNICQCQAVHKLQAGTSHLLQTTSAPEYLCSLLQPHHNTTSVRSSAASQFIVPHTRTEIGKCAFRVSAMTVWNARGYAIATWLFLYVRSIGFANKQTSIWSASASPRRANFVALYAVKPYNPTWPAWDDTNTTRPCRLTFISGITARVAKMLPK